MNLGESIKSLRKRKNISQGELALSCKITQAYLSQIENNRKEPNLATLKTISKELDVPLPIIFYTAMSEEDIPDSKKEAFGMINPSLNNLISSIFLSETT